MRPWLGAILLFVCLLLVTHAAHGQTACGPPEFNCSRSDLVTAQLPQRIPNVGAQFGAGKVIKDPDFKNPISRCTDAGTLATPFSIQVTPSGGSEDNIWNQNSTFLTVSDTGGRNYVMNFDPDTMVCSYTKFEFTGSSSWSYVNPLVLFNVIGTQLVSWTFAPAPTTAKPVKAVIADFANILPSGFLVTWHAPLSQSDDDRTFMTAYSDAGFQGTGVFAVLYRVGQGYRLYNTATGVVSGSWGTTGTISKMNFSLHEVKLNKSGLWATLSKATCFAGDCLTVGPPLWEVDTLNINECTPSCKGHNYPGYNSIVDGNEQQFGQFNTRLMGNVLSFKPVAIGLPIVRSLVYDTHASWQNGDPADSLPFIVTFATPTSPFPGPLLNEAVAYMKDGTVRRFFHTFITGRSTNFRAKYAIAAVSQDSHFLAFSSDWQNTLGFDVKGVQRVDVFVGKLQ